MKVPHLALQGVSTEFVLSGNAMYRTLLEGVWLAEMELNKINENKLRTHTLQSKVRYFHVTPSFHHLSCYDSC